MITSPPLGGEQEGAYYVTIVTWQRGFLFGNIVNQEMMLSKHGQIADACWREIPNHFQHVELGAYIIMPNHVHGIIVINDDCRGAIYRAPTDDANIEKFGKPVKGSLPTIIRTYKAAVTRLIGRELNETPSGNAIITNISSATTTTSKTKPITSKPTRSYGNKITKIRST